MKRRCLFKMSTLWLVLALFSSCDDDDGNNFQSNLQIYGLPLELSSGVIRHGNTNQFYTREEYIFEDTYTDSQGQQTTDKVEGFKAGDEEFNTGNFIVSLYGPQLRYNEDLQTTVGKDVCLCLHFASEDTEQLKAGKYTFSEMAQKYTFTAWVSSEYDMIGNQNTIATINKGEVEVEIEGSNYRISFNCETDFGGTVKGIYEGPLAKGDIFRDILSSFQDVKLEGLLSQVEYVYDGWFGVGEYKRETTLDINLSKAYMIASTGGTRVTNNSSREAIDIALVYNEAANEVLFEAPIRMRKYTGHNKSYDCPCYTIYCKAPATFTDADFDQLTEEDFDFAVEDEQVSLSLDNFTTGYVFFLTGNGLKGVIKIKSFTPYESSGVEIKIDYDASMNVFYSLMGPASPSLMLDIKCPGSINYSKIM